MSTARVQSLLAGELNWDAILALADDHGVQGMLARCLEDAGYTNVPGAVRETLHSRMRAQSLFTLSLTAELFRILNDFSKAGIDTMPVKGPVISELAYGDPSLRSFGDLDLLLRQRDIPHALERMQAMGFEPDVPATVLRSGRIPGEYLFRRPGTPRLVELHTECTFRHYPHPMRLEDMLARKRTLLLDGREIPALSLEDEVLFDCIHGGKDFWERLMWVSDVAAIITKYPEIDWSRTRRAAADVKAERMLIVGINLATVVFGLDLPAPIAGAVHADSQVAALCAEIQQWLPYAGSRPPSVTRRALYRVKMAGGGVPGLEYLTRLALSPSEDDWDADARERRFPLWEAVRRPFRLIHKYRSGQ